MSVEVEVLEKLHLRVRFRPKKHVEAIGIVLTVRVV